MRFYILIILCILTTEYSKAQQQTYFHFDRITTQQGLPSDNTKKIIQDKQGFIWIGTSEGLCRYDGYHVTTFTYNPAQPHSLLNNFIYDLSEDENGNIWIATAGGWCELLYNTQTFLSAKDFKNFHGKAPDYFAQFILADHHHHIIMGGYAGSCLLNLKDSSFQQFHLSKTNTVQTAGLINIYQDAQSLVWLQFQNYDCIYNPFKNELNIAFKNSGSYPLIKSSIPLLKQGNTLWIGRWSSYVCTYNLQTQSMKIVGKDTAGIKALTNDIQPRKMIADRQGNLWLLLEEEGVYYMDFTHKNFQVIKNDVEDYNSLPSQLVRDIMMDRDGNIWIATDKGIARWNNHAENFQQLQYTNLIPSFIPASRSNFEIDDVIENDSELWMAVLPVGLLVMNKNHLAICRHIEIDSGNRVSGMNRIINALFKDRDGDVWLSTQEGYARYDKQRDCLKPFYLSRQDITGNLYYQTSMMLQDDEGTIWVASKKGLGKLNAKTNNVTWFMLPATHKTGAPFFIYKIASQNHKLLWLATDGGLFSFNKNTNLFSRYSSFNMGDDWQAFNDCSDILFISDTVMMIASRYSGLIKFNYENKKFKIYSTNNGLSSNNICGLYADKFNGLWITTLNGLSRLNLQTQTFSHYDYSNGLKDLTFPGNKSFYPEKDGNVLLLNGSYLFRFNPAQFAKKENVPQVAFTSFEKYDSPVFYDKPLNEINRIHLAYNERYFTIRFSTLNFENASRTQYAYKMDGLDKQWHITSTPYVAYSNLSGGTYNLFVKASLDGNLWGNEKHLSILITPPFWKTWWFYTACAALALLLIFLFYRMRINQLKHELYLRTKIARDLHDDVGSTLSSLHLVSALATKKIADDPHKTKELLEKITDSSERMTGNMQDIVWAINPLNDSFAEIIARMQKFAAQMLESKNIELIFDADEKIKSIKVPLQYRSDLFMLFKEAVNNLAKYSSATHAWITLNKNNKTFFLEIKDDGVGFNMQNIKGGNGLRNMQERAKTLNGKLTVLSGINGTTITLAFNA